MAAYFMTSSLIKMTQILDHQKESMCEQVVKLAQINSGSHNLAGLAEMAQALCVLFAPLGGEQQLIDLPSYDYIDVAGRHHKRALGQALHIKKRPEAPLQVLLVGHMDTVFGPEHPFQQVTRLDEQRLQGPGVADLKGGLVVMLKAIEVLEKSDLNHSIGWEIFINPDEEMGSPGSIPWLEGAAKRHHVGLVFEPSLPNGNLVSERKGSGNFTLEIHGRAAHSGRDFDKGRSALLAAARLIEQLHAYNGKRPGLTLNVGFCHGGGALNIVPDHALLRFNVRFTDPSDAAWLEVEMHQLIHTFNTQDGLHVQAHGAIHRPPKLTTPEQQKLITAFDSCAKDLNININLQASGGSCDGNNLLAAGLPNIDNLGVRGDHIHTDREYMMTASLVERARLTALFLLNLAQRGHPL